MIKPDKFESDFLFIILYFVKKTDQSKCEIKVNIKYFLLRNKNRFVLKLVNRILK